MFKFIGELRNLKTPENLPLNSEGIIHKKGFLSISTHQFSRGMSAPYKPFKNYYVMKFLGPAF